MMPTRSLPTPLALSCPTCGAGELLYSCDPSCCFNHVCARCRTTFQTATRALGGRLDPPPPAPERESTDPAAPCCECLAVAIVGLEGGGAACSACGARVEVLYEDIAPA